MAKAKEDLDSLKINLIYLLPIIIVFITFYIYALVITVLNGLLFYGTVKPFVFVLTGNILFECLQ